MEFDYSLEKNELLLYKRGINFFDVIEAINDKGILLDFKHPNVSKYPNQRIMVVNINDYTWCVPYIKKGETFFLKTVFPARRFKYLIKDFDNE